MKDDDPWDENPFDDFRNFEEFLEEFKEFINSPFAQKLMKQIFQNFRFFSKQIGGKRDRDGKKVPKIFQNEQFKKFFERFMENSNLNMAPFPQNSETKGTFNDKRGKEREQLSPPSSVYEEENQVRVSVDLPGVTREQIEVNPSTKKVEVKAKNKEREYHKVINLPKKIDPTQISSRYENGVLELILEKQ